MSKGTEGPWSVFDNGVGRTYVASENGTLICFIESDDENVDSDADLIAAAPELLEALNKLFGADMEYCMEMDGKQDQLDAIEFARAAIAKATGQ